MAENMQGKTSFVRSRRGIALVVFLCLVVFDLVMMSVSFARYVTQSNQNASATVGGFTPVLHCGESWELEESFRITGDEGTTSLPFAVNNATSTTPVTVLVTLTVEDILPLSFELYAGSTLLSPTSESGNVRIRVFDGMRKYRVFVASRLAARRRIRRALQWAYQRY